MYIFYSHALVDSTYICENSASATVPPEELRHIAIPFFYGDRREIDKGMEGMKSLKKRGEG